MRALSEPAQTPMEPEAMNVLRDIFDDPGGREQVSLDAIRRVRLYVANV